MTVLLGVRLGDVSKSVFFFQYRYHYMATVCKITYTVVQLMFNVMNHIPTSCYALHQGLLKHVKQNFTHFVSCEYNKKIIS